MMRLFALVALIAFFLWDLVASSVAVARIILSPRIRTRPAIVVLPTRLRRRWAVGLFAYFTSVTPGSTCLHVSDDGRTLYLHLLDFDGEAALTKFVSHYERFLLRLER